MKQKICCDYTSLIHLSSVYPFNFQWGCHSEFPESPIVFLDRGTTETFSIDFLPSFVKCHVDLDSWFIVLLLNKQCCCLAEGNIQRKALLAGALYSTNLAWSSSERCFPDTRNVRGTFMLLVSFSWESSKHKEKKMLQVMKETVACRQRLFSKRATAKSKKSTRYRGVVN